MGVGGNMNSVFKVLEERAWQQSADYAEIYMKDAMIFEDETKKDFYQYIKSKVCKDNGLITEFGVHKGYSINILADLFPFKTIYGFDSFRGLPEDWKGTQFAENHFLINDKPDVPHNVELIVGWFDNTIEPFLEQHLEPMNLINIDCDIYNSTKTVLDSLTERIITGTIIVFDEYFGYNNWQDHEHRAWKDFVLENKIKYKYIAVNQNQVAVKVL